MKVRLIQENHQSLGLILSGSKLCCIGSQALGCSCHRQRLAAKHKVGWQARQGAEGCSAVVDLQEASRHGVKQPCFSCECLNASGDVQAWGWVHTATQGSSLHQQHLQGRPAVRLMHQHCRSLLGVSLDPQVNNSGLLPHVNMMQLTTHCASACCAATSSTPRG